MLVDIYPWHNNIWQSWQQLLAQERLHHAILLSAPCGSGKTALAGLLAKTLLCKNSKQEQKGREVSILPCCHCHSCLLFAADTHPDLHWIKPEVTGKQIGVEQIRQVTQYAWQSSQLGGERVILIEDADKMGDAGANALLKTLEEPPLRCHFILLVSSISRLLPTVVSRCNKWIPKLADENIVKQWLENELKMSVSLQTVRLHRGAPLAAKNFVESGNIKNHQSILNEMINYLTHKQGLFSLTDKLVKSDQQGLRWLSYLFLDVMKLQQGTKEGLVHTDLVSKLSTLSTRSPPTLICTQLQELNKLQALIVKHSGLNKELLISSWLSGF